MKSALFIFLAYRGEQHRGDMAMVCHSERGSEERMLLRHRVEPPLCTGAFDLLSWADPPARPQVLSAEPLCLQLLLSCLSVLTNPRRAQMSSFRVHGNSPASLFALAKEVGLPSVTCPPCHSVIHQVPSRGRAAAPPGNLEGCEEWLTRAISGRTAGQQDTGTASCVSTRDAAFLSGYSR